MTNQTSAPLLTPRDNLFGICHRVGADLGFNPLWLRLAFGVVLILNPVVVIGAYFALGAAVVTSRLLFPQRAVAAPMVVPVAPPAKAYEPLPLAA